VAEERRRAAANLVDEEQDDARVGDEHAGELPKRQPVARDQEVGEDDRVDGVEVQEDRGVRRARERGADVHGADLEGEEETEEDERPPLGACHAEAGESSRCPRPEPDDATARYDTGRAELHTGVARVPDPRVDRLSALFKPKKTTYASFEVVDLAGIAKGERGGLETKEFRDADALLHVVRAFPDEVAGPP